MAEPKVRFKRDDGGIFPAWEQGRFGDLIEVYDEKVTSDCTLPVLTSSKTDGIQYQSDHFGREQLHDITGYNVIPRGYCTYRNRSDGTDFTFNINNLCDRGIVSKFYPVFHTTARCNLYFLMTLMNNEPKTVRKIAMTAKGTGQKVLSFLDLQKIEINIPSLEEQQKIADFLSSVDDVITASEEEVANLETQKKAVMKKIFSQEVRFKRADGSDFPEWEEKRLDEVVEFLDGMRKPIETGDRVAGPYPYYGASGITDYVEGYIFDEDLILLSEDGANILDRNYRVCFMARGKYWVNNHAHVLRANTDCVNEYICEYLESLDYSRMNSGSAQPKLNQQTCRKIPVKKPCLEEQRLIAEFLSYFDEAIAAAKKELELWKELKKGLLQQMFV